MQKLKVKNSGYVILESFNDYPDGELFIAEAKKNIPFSIKRVYFINSLFLHKSVRGRHAHRKLKQVIFSINGSFSLKLDDGQNKQTIKLKSPKIGVILNKKLWMEMTDFSPNCVILVLASDYYDESDYIRNYDEFLKIAKSSERKNENTVF